MGLLYLCQRFSTLDTRTKKGQQGSQPQGEGSEDTLRWPARIAPKYTYHLLSVHRAYGLEATFAMEVGIARVSFKSRRLQCAAYGPQTGLNKLGRLFNHAIDMAHKLRKHTLIQLKKPSRDKVTLLRKREKSPYVFFFSEPELPKGSDGTRRPSRTVSGSKMIDFSTRGLLLRSYQRPLQLECMIGAYHILLDFRPVICGRLAYGSSKQGSEWGIDMTSRHAVFGYQRMQQADHQSRTYDVINTLGFPGTSASYTHAFARE